MPALRTHLASLPALSLPLLVGCVHAAVLAWLMMAVPPRPLAISLPQVLSISLQQAEPEPSRAAPVHAAAEPPARVRPVAAPATPRAPGRPDPAPALAAPEHAIAASSSEVAAAAPATPPAAPHAEAPAGPTEPPIFDAAYLNNPAPAYPAISYRLGEQGRVELRVHVTADGRADAVELIRSSGYERLDQAAREAVQGWRFAPARQDGGAVAAWVRVPLRFSLKS